MRPHHRHWPNAFCRSQGGFTLIEVLISVIVLSVGLLGLAALQASALRNNQSSLERSLAVVESYSIVDAMRVDRTNAINGAFNLGLDENPDGGGTTFSGNELVKWRARLVQVLGADGTGSVACNGADCTVIVQWNDERGTGGETEQQIQTQVQL
jgi:type IV pilus assembly protein PilV